MSSENRDFVIERLERKLAEKEEEIETISSKLHDSIMKELREDLKNDLDINNRLIKIEQKVQELSSNMSGIMDELLDQKSQLRNLGTDSSKEASEPFKVTATKDPFKPLAPNTTEGRGQANKGNLANTLFSNKKPETAAVSEMKAATHGTSSGSQWSKLVDPNEVNMEIREISCREPVQEPPASIPTEYIVAEGGDAPGNRNHLAPPEDECEYIVAEEGKPSRTLSETEYETVEDRDDEDTVVTTTRRKPL